MLVIVATFVFEDLAHRHFRLTACEQDVLGWLEHHRLSLALHSYPRFQDEQGDEGFLEVKSIPAYWGLTHHLFLRRSLSEEGGLAFRFHRSSSRLSGAAQF